MLLNCAQTWQFLLGTDELDISPVIGSWSIQQPQASIGQPLVWTGQIDLSEALSPYFPHSLDDRYNPTRWQKGQRIKTPVVS